MVSAPRVLGPHFSRSGFSLVECVVAMLLLSVGVLGLASAGVTAMRALSGVDRAHLAAVHARGVLDSLVLLERPSSGMQLRDGLRLDWQVTASVVGSRIDLTVRDGASQRIVEAFGFAAQWPHRMGRFP